MDVVKNFVEPMVGFEPTTYSLQNCCSNQLSYIGMVGREGFEPPKALPADLQSAPFDRFGTYPCICINL